MNGPKTKSSSQRQNKEEMKEKFFRNNPCKQLKTVQPKYMTTNTHIKFFLIQPKGRSMAHKIIQNEINKANSFKY